MLESCDYYYFFFFLIIFKFVSSSTICSNYYFFMIAIFRLEILYTVCICPPKNNGSRTLTQFFLSNDIHNLQTTLISTKCNQKNNNNNMKLNSTSSEPYIRLERAIRLQNKLNGKIRLSSFNLKYTSEYNPTR